MKHCHIKNLLEKNLDTMNGKSDRKLWCTSLYSKISAILDD